MAEPIDPLAANTLRRMYGVDQTPSSDLVAANTLRRSAGVAPSPLDEGLAVSTANRAAAINALGSGQRLDPAALQQIDKEASTLSDEALKGLRRFGYSALATSKAFAGQMIEPVAPQLGRSIIESGAQTMRNMGPELRPAVENFKDVDGLRQFGLYAAGALGEGAPSIAMNLVGGGVGGLAAKALGRSVLAGRIAGGTATMLPMEGGETALDIYQDPKALANTTPAERAALSLGRGAVNAGLESVVPQMMIAPRLMGQAARIGPGLGNALRNTALAAGEGALGEYGTEFAQELTGQAAQKIARGDPLTRGYDFEKANEAGIRGAITGGVAGGAGGVAQGVYSNFGPVADKAGELVDKAGNAFGAGKKAAPGVGDFISRLRSISENPEQFGADVANTTLEALAESSELATKGRQAAGRGIEAGVDALGTLKTELDRFAINNVKPEDREWYAEQTARLGSMTAGQYQLFKEALQAKTGKEFVEGIFKTAGALKDPAVEGAKAVWSWTKDAATGFADAVRGNKPGKQSFVIYGDEDRRSAEQQLKLFSPSTYEVLKSAPIAARRKILDTLLRARDEPGYFDATDANGNLLRKDFIDGWQQTFGSDIRKTAKAMNAARNSTTLVKARALADSKNITLDDQLERMERRVPGATRAESALSEFNIRRNTPTLEEERAGPTRSDEGAQMDEDKPYTTPFDLKTFQDSLSASNFDRKDPGAGGVEVKLSAEGLKPSELAQLIGKKEAVKVGNKWEGKTAPYSAQELAKFDADNAVKTRVSLQSLWGTAKNAENRAKFAEFIPEFTDSRTTDERAGDASFALLGQLANDGFKIQTADGREINVKVELPQDLKTGVQSNMVIRRKKAREPYTYGDYTGDNRRAVSRENQLKALTKVDSMKELQELAGGGDKAAARAVKVIQGKLKSLPGSGPIAGRVQQALDGYRAELRDKIENAEVSRRIQHDLEAIKEALVNDYLSPQDVRTLSEYYTGNYEGDKPSFLEAKRIMRVLGARIGNKLMSRMNPRAVELGERLAEMLEQTLAGREDFFDSITGRNAGNPSDSVDSEFLATKQEAQQAADTERAANLQRQAENTTPREKAQAAARAAVPTPTDPNDRRILKLPYVGPDATPLAERLKDAIASARNLSALEKLGKAIARTTSELDKEALAALRTQYNEKKAALLEGTIVRAIFEAPSKLRLMQIGKRINERKAELREKALVGLRSLYSARMYELENLYNPSNRFDPSDPDAIDPASARESRDTGSTPPPSGASAPASPPPTPRQKKAREKFVKALEKLVGKRLSVEFGKTLEPGVAARYMSRDDALAEARSARRGALVEMRKNGKTKKLQQAADEAKAEEKRILADKAILGVVYVATGMETKAGLAEHEAFHGAFAFFFSNEERRILGTAFSQGLVAKRLKEYFKGNDEILAIIEDSPEEAAAYGFQVWMLDPSKLKLGEQTQTLFERFKQFLRDLFGILTPEQKAELILNDLKSGRRAEKGTSPIAKQLDKDRPWTERAQQFSREIGGLVKSGYDIMLTPVYERLVDMENPVITQIAKKVYSRTGEEGRSGMVQRTMAETRRFYNEAALIYDGLSEEQLKALHDAGVYGKAPTDPMLKERWEKVNKLYKDLYAYQRSAGVNLNDAGIKSNYYPLTWDPEKVLKNKEAFLKMLSKYEKELTTAMKTPEEIYEGITGYIERGEDLVNVMGRNNEPLAEHVRTRTLAFISRKDRREFMTDDPIGTTMRYIKQAVRQAEYIRDFGMGGTKLQGMMDAAAGTYGASRDQMALVNDYINGALGNKGIDMSRQLKDLYGGLTVYQNVRLLPFSIFSSLVDPLGIAVRSNSASDAWNTFTYSLKNLFRDWKSQYTPDAWEKIAVDWGIIERAGTTVSTENLYTGITLRGTTKKINDAFFKYNLLNGWVRSNHIMAVAAAQRFFHRAAEGMFKDDSARYLEEVGLSKDDIVYDQKLDRIMMTAQELVAAGKSEKDAKAIEGRLREATRKFVRQSLLNPTAPELANWASNPYLAPIAHLKQFVWAFNSTIIARIENELQYGNYKPLMLAAAYVPGMIAADFLKDMVSNFGDEPPYKKDWGVLDYVDSGIKRSGLTGTGMFFVDAKEDIMRGGSGIESLAGPTLEQMKKAVSAFGSGDNGAMYRWMVKALPANAAYDQVLLD